MEGSPQTDRLDHLTPQEINCLTRPAAQDMTRKLAAAASVIGQAWSELLATAVDARWDEPAAQRPAAGGPAGWRDTPCLVRLGAGSGQLLVEVESCLAAALIDRQLGASSAAPSVRPTLTPVERRLLGRAAQALAARLDRHWAGRLQLDGKVQVEAAGDEKAAPAAADFQVALLGARGRLRLSLCGELIQRLDPPVAAPPQQVTAVLATLQLPRAELANLAVGDIIATDTPADQELDLLVEGRLCYRGSAGRAGARKAVRVTSAVARPGAALAGCDRDRAE